MKQTGKFSLALHTLGHLALDPTRPRTSEELAAMHGTHPVVVRRVLGPLRAAGILLSEKGHGGGWRLARPAEAVTLEEIYRALDEPFLTPIAFAPAPGHPCAIEAAMAGTVAAALTEAEAVIARHFAARSLADIARALPPAGSTGAAPGQNCQVSASPAPDSPL